MRVKLNLLEHICNVCVVEQGHNKEEIYLYATLKNTNRTINYHGHVLHKQT